MKFVSPEWLWALLALPLVFGWLWVDERRRRKRLAVFAAAELWPALIPEALPGARLRKAGVFLAAAALALLAMARPQWGYHEEVVKASGLDVMVVLDLSNSMEVEDVIPSRLKKAKHIVSSLLGQMEGDRMGLVAFAGSAYLACPLTTDLGYVQETLDILSPKLISTQGTDISAGLETARKSLERGAEDSASPSQAVVLISDGEDQEPEAFSEAALLAKAGARFFVIGVGTQKGGPIPIRDENGQMQGYKRAGGRSEAVVSAFKPDYLSKLASSGSGRYWTSTNAETEVGEILSELGGMSRGEFAERRQVIFEDRYQFPLALAVLLLLIELGLPARKLGAAALVGVLSLGLAAILPAPAQASPPVGVYLENRKGLEALQAGRPDEALQLFESAQARDPSLPELDYNQGVVRMQQGDAEAAAQQFDKSAGDAEQRGLSGLAARSRYNQGTALSAKGDRAGAIQSYIRAIQGARQANDPALEADARKNLELLSRQDQQQQQQQQQNKKDSKESKESPQESSKESSKDSSKDSKDKQQQQQQQQQSKPQEYEDPSQSRRRQRFQSEKMSPEDAERVMSELANRERDLQLKLKRQQNGRTQKQRSGKDW